jgi:hypothetical protein
MKQTLQVEFKTNELIITDWISIDEFDAQVGPTKLLSSYGGTTASTEEAAKHGFVRVHVGDVDPTIHKKDNNFSFDMANDKKGYENIGSVEVRVWAVTIIEKQKLVDIVANKVGTQQAEKLVKAYLKTNNHTLANIEPGIYTLEFNPEGAYAKESFSLKKDKVTKTKKMKM